MSALGQYRPFELVHQKITNSQIVAACVIGNAKKKTRRSGFSVVATEAY